MNKRGMIARLAPDYLSGVIIEKVLEGTKPSLELAKKLIDELSEYKEERIMESFQNTIIQACTTGVADEGTEVINRGEVD